ncbi:hypothetical protein PHMEG_00017726 [Phytophthora megakarya]|uniref:KaiA C-terminal domain-containing protein n=1 Tax=Phytophthora megakarya TaxID=4795 RepID=A0A225VWL2_9STRA|nr:hypothetical protein PHMEG_00017726 [Phytophthora megakarya]
MQYVFVLKDSLTHYCELFPCSTPTANVAAEGLIEWYKRYGCPFRLFSDQGVHFRNQTVWPYLLPVVQTNINHTKMRSLADHSLAELFTGLESPSPLDMIVRPTQLVDIKERKRLSDMQRKAGSGLFRIIETLPHTFNIQHLVTNKMYEVHGTRLKYYADTDLNMYVEMRELVTSQGIVLDVAAIVDHRYNQDPHRWGLRVQWVGLQPIEDSWDGITMMRKDVP